MHLIISVIYHATTINSGNIDYLHITVLLYMAVLMFQNTELT